MSVIDTNDHVDPVHLTDDQLLAYVAERHTAAAVPPCRLCGAPLSLECSHPKTWRCTGKSRNADGSTSYAEGRSLVDAHYSQSEFIQRGFSDPWVLELVRRYRLSLFAHAQTNPSFFYRFEGLNLRPGEKTAGFLFCVQTSAMIALAANPAPPKYQEWITATAQERLQRAGIIDSELIREARIGFANASLCPKTFAISAVFGSSIGADPEEYAALFKPGPDNHLPREITYTPHNVDSPKIALALLILTQTWAETAQVHLHTIRGLSAVSAVD